MKTETLKNTLSLLYTTTTYPVFLINMNYKIISGPDSFFDLPDNYFQEIVNKIYNPTYKMTTYFASTEFYSLIPYQSEDVEFIIIGPILYHIPYEKSEVYENEFLNSLDISLRSLETLKKLPHTSDKFFSFLQLFYEWVKEESLTISEILESFKKIREDVQDFLLFHNLKHIQREKNDRPYPYHLEKKLLYYLSKGESTRTRTVATEIISYREIEIDNIEQLDGYRYTFAQMSSLFRQRAIECGVDSESAFILANLYLQKIHKCQSGALMYNIYMDMILDFATLIKNKRFHEYPSWVRNCMDYIISHLHETMTLKELSQVAHFQPAYVSVQFKKICGYSIVDFINQKKIEEAKFLLEESEMSIVEISTILAFSSQSYFTNVFKKYQGCTPKEYKKRYSLR